MAKINVEELIASLKEMSVLELNELVKALEEEFGVSAAAGVVVAAGPAEAAEVEEKTEFDVELTEIGPNKVKVIKEGTSKTDAEDLKAKLEAEGAKVTLK